MKRFLTHLEYFNKTLLYLIMFKIIFLQIIRKWNSPFKNFYGISIRNKNQSVVCNSACSIQICLHISQLVKFKKLLKQLKTSVNKGKCTRIILSSSVFDPNIHAYKVIGKNYFYLITCTATKNALSLIIVNRHYCNRITLRFPVNE